MAQYQNEAYSEDVWTFLLRLALVHMLPSDSNIYKHIPCAFECMYLWSDPHISQEKSFVFKFCLCPWKLG